MDGSNRNRRRLAFSLVELLVVLAVVGLLMGLLLPAVQVSREAARRLHCANNLRQLGIAAHGFHETHKRLPPGFLGTTPVGGWPSGRDQNLGMLAYLTPHLGLQMIHDEIDIEMEVTKIPPAPRGERPRVPWWSKRAPGTWAIAQAKVSHFLCPSTNVENYTWGVAQMLVSVADPPGSLPVEYIWYYEKGGSADHLGKTNYLGTAGFGGEAHGSERLRGVFTNRSRTALRDIRDGASNTTMMGELGGGTECRSGKR